MVHWELRCGELGKGCDARDRCVSFFRNSLELQMCKRVGIELEGGASFVDLFQKEFSTVHKQNTKQFKPGEYPEPCQMEIPNVEIFHVGLFLIVRIYEPNNPFFVKFEVSRIELINKSTF